MQMSKETRKALLAQVFNAASQSYDCASLQFFKQSAEHLVKLLSLKGNEKIFYVATGTGHCALEAARKVPLGDVYGIDIADEMIASARKKAFEENLVNVKFLQMDIESLSDTLPSFDYATCGFVLFFLDDMVKAIKCIASKVKQNGVIAFTSFDENFLSPFIKQFTIDLAGVGISIPANSQRLSTKEQCEQLMVDANLEMIGVYHQDHSFKITSANEWWDLVMGSALRGWVSAVPGNMQEKFIENHLRTIQLIIENETNVVPVGVLYSLGKKIE
jgi:ubiquinone/menaquinone biosynthesis C-methylase UbiE